MEFVLTPCPTSREIYIAVNPSTFWAVDFDVRIWLYICAMLATQFGSVDDLFTLQCIMLQIISIYYMDVMLQLCFCWGLVHSMSICNQNSYLLFATGLPILLYPSQLLSIHWGWYNAVHLQTIINHLTVSVYACCGRRSNSSAKTRMGTLVSRYALHSHERLSIWKQTL